MKYILLFIAAIVLSGIIILSIVIYQELPDTSNWGAYQSYQFDSNKYKVENALLSVIFNSDDLFLDPKSGHYNSDGWMKIYFDSLNSKESYTIRFTNRYSHWISNEQSELFIQWMFIKNGVNYSKKEFRNLDIDLNGLPAYVPTAIL